MDLIRSVIGTGLLVASSLTTGGSAAVAGSVDGFAAF